LLMKTLRQNKKRYLLVKVEVTNTGDYAGEETVQLYVRDVAASLVRPVKELKAFKKVFLQPGEKELVQMEVWKKDLGFYDDDMNIIWKMVSF
jgi:beta-glucosidase